MMKMSALQRSQSPLITPSSCNQSGISIFQVFKDFQIFFRHFQDSRPGKPGLGPFLKKSWLLVIGLHRQSNLYVYVYVRWSMVKCNKHPLEMMLITL